MTKREFLEQYAHRRRIKIIHTRTTGAPALSANWRGRAVVLIDYNRLSTEPERTEALAHEIMHLEHGTCNSRYTRHTPPGKFEHQTDAHVIEALLPKLSLAAALASNQGRLWEVAEEMGVSEALIRRAIQHYGAKDQL